MATESEPRKLQVEVAYASPERQVIVRIDVPRGCTVGEAIERSALREQFPDMVVDPDRVGIFSRKVELDHVLRLGDRVEIYRPLIADPKESRRKRAGLPGKK